MKKLRILLSVFALVIAVGATFAMRADTAMTGYQFIPASPGVPEQCIQQTVNCVISEDNDCTLGDYDVKRYNNQTHCGPVLKRP